MKKTLLAVVVLLLAASTAFAQFGTTSATTLTLTVGAEASIQADSSTPLTTSGTIFNDYGGTTNFTYKVRTGTSVNTAGITLEITKDFGSAASGPSVANSGSTGDTLKYTCTATASSATACGSAQTSSTTAATTVATFAASAHSVKAGDSGSVIWDLVNDPAYAVGSYTATATFTISAT
jgi:hypothetical protein